MGKEVGDCNEDGGELDGADDEQASEVIAQWDLDDEQLVGTVAASMSRMHVVLGV